ncbi:MAG TPA: tRNA (N6-threonylcarbamoyladenosine(37)-N6)-methyltransferase TrmO [Thermoleophilaceae bacterium]
MTPADIDIRPIGRVESPLTDRAAAPKQGHEGAPDAWLVFEPDLLEGLRGIRPGDEVIVLTWLDRSDRDVLEVHPRDDVSNPLRGVFGTRSADRPNPVGLHEVVVVSIEGPRVLVRNLEALDGTPIVDVKPVLGRRGPRVASGGGTLGTAAAATRLPAQDLERARRFYAEKLRLEPVDERPGGLLYRCGAGGEFALFASGGVASGEHTQMGFEVDDVEAAVRELRERGVVFETVDVPGLKTVDGIADVEGNYPSKGGVGERAAWFRDSEGNLLGMGQRLG